MNRVLEIGTPVGLKPAGRDACGLAQAMDERFGARLEGFVRVSSVDVSTDDGLLPPGLLEMSLVECRMTGKATEGRLVWEVQVPSVEGRPVVVGTVVTIHRTDSMTPTLISVGEAACSPRIMGPLPIGETHVAEYVVTNEMTTAHVTGRPPVLSTPALVACMEQTAKRLADPHLAVDHSVVGFEVDIRHHAPAFADQAVVVSAVLVGRRRSRLCIAVEVRCDDRLIGHGRVTSHVIPSPPD